MGQGKHAVEVGDRQQVTETRFHPAHFRQRLAFRTVAILAQIAEHLGTTVVALRQLPPRRRSDRRRCPASPALAARQAMPLLVGGAMCADVGDLYLLPWPVPSIRPGTWVTAPQSGDHPAVPAATVSGGDGAAPRVSTVRWSSNWYAPSSAGWWEIHPGFQEMGGKGVTK